jgi:KUP system potassium uptake protein
LGSFLVLGSVLLAVTGAEALYADMGHFGKRAIRIAWFALVAPALVLNYFGQGALLMADPKALENPFYLAFPDWALYPMVALATAATVIASQATISGAYSMTHQAIKLGYLPRMSIHHTSSKAMGQIYVPVVNWVLLAAVVLAVIGFGSSSRLASAYGVSVMGTMLATTILTFFVIRFSWRYPLWLCVMVTGFFMLVDATFLAAALHKVLEGGWFPLLLGAVIFSIMATWRQGRGALMERLRESSIPLRSFLDTLFRSPPHRVPGTAVFLNSTRDATPHALLHSLKHYNVLHEQNVFMTLQFLDVPWVNFGDRIQCEKLGHNCWRVSVRYGFMNRPDVCSALEHAQTRFGHVRQLIFSAMARNAGSATDFFNIPSNRVVELGVRIQL